MTDRFSILTVCTHNRTRSVVAAALLRHHADRQGLAVSISSTGTMVDGLRATEAARTHLARHGIALPDHRSSVIDVEMVEAADLILTAEPDHVVRIAGRWPDAFGRTFTLPEAARLAAEVGPRHGEPIADWLSEIAARRPPAKRYLERGAVASIDDPSNSDAAVWEAMIATIDEACATIIGALAD